MDRPAIQPANNSGFIRNIVQDEWREALALDNADFLPAVFRITDTGCDMDYILIKALLIIIAAIASAAADTVHHHPRTMIFKGKFWRMWPHDKFIPFTKYPLDGWHVSKSVMIICLITAGVLPGYLWYVDIPVAGVLWVLVFNLFYNKLFQK